MQLLTREICEAMPMLYANEDKGMDAPVVVKFFGGGQCSWYLSEATAYIDVGADEDYLEVPLSDIQVNSRNFLWHKDEHGTFRPVEDIRFFGLCRIHEAELGYVMWSELIAVRFPPFRLPIERDRHFGKKTLGECKVYEETGRWPVKENQ